MTDSKRFSKHYNEIHFHYSTFRVLVMRFESYSFQHYSLILSYVSLRLKQCLLNIFPENASLKKYFDATLKMGHPIYVYIYVFIYIFI